MDVPAFEFTGVAQGGFNDNFFSSPQCQKGWTALFQKICYGMPGALVWKLVNMLTLVPISRTTLLGILIPGQSMHAIFSRICVTIKHVIIRLQCIHVREY